MSEPPLPADPSPADLTGKVLGEFHLLRKLGQGGMGQVYLARQQSLKREVAVKILRDDHADNPTALKRFQAEAEAVARISHSNIVQVFATGESGGVRYMALEYVNGRNLREYLERKGPPDLPVALAVLKQVAAALQRAAELGLVHRDIKPENILVTRRVEVKVTDFGLSRYVAGENRPLSLTQSGMTLGTPLYMSPEQVQGKPVDHRSDLYSFGVTAYHLLAGFPPFRGSTPFEVAAQHVQAEADPLDRTRPDLPAELCGLVHKLMAKQPDARYQTAKDVIRDLSRISKGRTAASRVIESGAQPPLPTHAATLRLSLSGLGASGETVRPAAARARRWVVPGRVMGVVGLVVALLGGWWVHGLFGLPDTPPPVGLPEMRSPAPLYSARELALRDALRGSVPTDRKHQEVAIDLGLLLVAEHRLDEAEKVFADLDRPPPRPPRPGDQPLPVSGGVLARFGQGVVFAHQDKPADSNRAFEQAIGLLPNRPEMRKAVELLFLQSHPRFGQAVADAVNRNADNLAKDVRMPASVEWLRNPNSLLLGPPK